LGHPDLQFQVILRLPKDLLWFRRDSSPLRKASGVQKDRHRKGKAVGFKMTNQEGTAKVIKNPAFSAKPGYKSKTKRGLFYFTFQSIT
jgi:hypothetical protein